MKFRLCVLLWTLAGLAAPALAADKLESKWLNAPVTVDGDAGEWRDIVFTYYDNENTAVGVKNDSTNLYLIVLSRDEATVRRMEMRGVTIWISPDGKKKKNYGLRYHGGRAKSRVEKGSSQREMPMPDEQREDMLQEQGRLRKVIEVFTNKKSVEIPVSGERGPMAAAAFGNDVYSYEFRIPINGADSNQYSLGLQDRSKLAIGIHIGYLSDADKAKMKDRMEERGGRPTFGGGDGPGMGGGPPMGGGGNMGHGGPPGGRRPSEAKEFWIEVSLAGP